MSDPTSKIGGHEESIRALAFGSGGFDATLQLGVAHALLVSHGKPPDIVAGLAAGAINAVALAEILKAEPAGLPAAFSTTTSSALAQKASAR